MSKPTAKTKKAANLVGKAIILAELTKYPVKTRLSLTGTLIVARDIAHAQLKKLIDDGQPMPEYFKNHPIYYAGPAKTPQGKLFIR